jgi:signal transduction histidine kinase/PleD family two-component response regulator
MSIRIKVILIISSIVAFITASSMVLSIYYSRIQLIKTIEIDMAAVNRLAVRLVSSHLRLIRAEADTAVEDILEDMERTSPKTLIEALEKEAKKHQYLAMSMVTEKGEITASWGNEAPDGNALQTDYIRRSLRGERIFTSTQTSSRGTLVMRLYVPMENSVLVVTLPGQIFSEIIAEYRIWTMGNVLITDQEGVIIANIRPFLVEGRRTLSGVADWNYKPRQTRAFFNGLASGKSGTGIYSYGGAPRVGAYNPIPLTEGWTCIVAAPISESPANETRSILILSGAVFLGLGILAALLAGNFIARPFQKIKEQNQRLEELKATAENASKAKSNFLSNMSHEMRTPMNAIIGMTNIAKSAVEAERKDYCLSKIEDASAHLLGVINDILDMSKIEANKFDLNPERFHFEKMLQKVVNVITFRVDEKQQQFIVRMDEKIPAVLNGDDQRLAQVIANLLSNAVKFTPEKGSIRLDARLTAEKDGVCTIQISVSDSGIGISPEQQEKLFSAFTQAESNTTRKFGGTGLGLAISKRIVEIMGGRIWIESELGKGSTFIFTVQLERAEAEKQDIKLPEQERRALRILAVDDEKEVLEYFGEIMRRFKFPYDLASGAEEAWSLIEQKGPYSLYFIDWKMPGLNGIELTKKIRDLDSGKTPSAKPVVIMISAAEWAAIEEEAKKAGVDKFLSKPLFPSMIVDQINEHLGLDNSLKQIEPSRNDTPCFAGHRILLVEDVQINQEILLSILEPTALEIDCANNGREAVEKFSAAANTYEMIFMDVQMPEMDGYEATRQIRAIEAEHRNKPRNEFPLETQTQLLEFPQGIPIIAMTANVFREDIEKCLAAGMNDHVGKPINVEEVMEKLKEYLA